MFAVRCFCFGHLGIFVRAQQKLSSIMSLSTSDILSPAALTCWGMKLVAVMPGVVFISSRFICSFPCVPVRI